MKFLPLLLGLAFLALLAWNRWVHYAQVGNWIYLVEAGAATILGLCGLVAYIIVMVEDDDVG